jgi:predicted nuclease with TOPRIM domain
MDWFLQKVGFLLLLQNAGIKRSTQTLRRVEGITYWVIGDSKQIRRFINSNIRHEWEKDAETDEVDRRLDPWLPNLSEMKWSLQTIVMANVRLDPSMTRRQEFVARLEERSKQLRGEIELYDQVIWPLIIRGEDSVLEDGYCRYSTLKIMGVKRTLAYVGH